MLNIRQILNRKTLAILSSFFFIHSLVAQVNFPKNKVLVYATSAENNMRISISDTIEFKPQVQPKETEIAIFIDTTKTFQEIIGIGAAITDASSETFAKVSAESQQKLLESFFHPQKGIGYSLIRTNMNSCDFSSGSYTYVKEGDIDLKTFNIAPDTLYKIPLIQKAFNMTKQNLKLFISPWSPPAFMKDNNNMLKGGKLLPMYYQSWANYYVKFINGYEKLGVPVWGLTIQNEPMATQRWESCIYTAEEERDFLKKYLGPTLVKAGLSKKKIIVWDHNRDLIFQRVNVILADKEAAKYVWGIGYHWYETWTGGEQMHDNISLVNETYPSKNLFFTEGCKEVFNEAKYYNWNIGEFYAKSMIKDFNNGLTGFTDWNIFLDEKGGPNHVGNFCFAPVHVNTQTNEIIYTNAFYYIGHFSKFVRPGAKRIACSSSRSSLKATAFKNKDGKICVVVMNDGDKEINYMIQLGNQSVPVKSIAHTIPSILF